MTVSRYSKNARILYRTILMYLKHNNYKYANL